MPYQLIARYYSYLAYSYWLNFIHWTIDYCFSLKQKRPLWSSKVWRNLITIALKQKQMFAMKSNVFFSNYKNYLILLVLENKSKVKVNPIDYWINIQFWTHGFTADSIARRLHIFAGRIHCSSRFSFIQVSPTLLYKSSSLLPDLIL